MRSNRWAILVSACWIGLAAGCADPVTFPEAFLPEAAQKAGAWRAWDADGDGRADVFAFAGDDSGGRVTQLGYDRNRDGACDERVRLDDLPISHCRHLVIILDGFGHELIKEYYDAGGLRMFHAPSRVICPYPAMSDLSLPDILDDQPARGMEAVYYDRKAGRRVGGTASYLLRRNKSYTRLLQYSGHPVMDVFGYLHPWRTFRKETKWVKQLFDRRRSQETIAYIGTSAAVGTLEGAEGQRRCLGRIERLVWQVLAETGGLTKVTLLADHGQGYVPSKRLPLEGLLAEKGWRVTGRLRGGNDVVTAPFGLISCARFATLQPGRLAADLAGIDGVELASFAAGDTVVVLAPDGQRAVISRRGERFRYEPIAGDPLELCEILPKIPADEAGYRDADALLTATARHRWPAPLQRLWRTHFGLVESPPDVICSLAGDVFYGSGYLASKVDIASAHGGLDRANSTTFIMSTAAPLPPVMRSRDIPRELSKLTGRPWPLGK
ncbi:MAG TPA: hypothetical protein VM389_07280 [Phycisphaerae bacterium]|nr:hypothetical protein [Phycisphaerae bacterium]